MTYHILFSFGFRQNQYICRTHTHTTFLCYHLLTKIPKTLDINSYGMRKIYQKIKIDKQKTRQSPEKHLQQENWL